MDNVITTDAVMAALNNHLNSKNQLALLQALMGAVQDKVNALPAELQPQIDALQAQLDIVSQKADILESFELGQVEEALKATLENLDAAGLFDSLCIQIGDNSYRLFSVVQALASADKVQKVNFIWNVDHTEITGVTMTLTDGSVVTLNGASTEIDEDGDGTNETVKYTFITDNWKGLTAGFECKFRKIEKTYVIFDQNIAGTELHPVEQNNIVFDLTVGLETCSALTPEEATPDLNEDGTVGVSDEDDGAVI
ncbi:hypothetical protein [Desulfovulcanus sp.]